MTLVSNNADDAIQTRSPAAVESNDWHLICFNNSFLFGCGKRKPSRLPFYHIIFIGLLNWKQRKKNVNRSTVTASLRVRVTFRFWPYRYGLPRWLPISKCDSDTYDSRHRHSQSSWNGLEKNMFVRLHSCTDFFVFPIVPFGLYRIIFNIIHEICKTKVNWINYCTSRFP